MEINAIVKQWIVFQPKQLFWEVLGGPEKGLWGVVVHFTVLQLLALQLVRLAAAVRAGEPASSAKEHCQLDC